LRCLVDKSVLNAHVYFKTYLREPSPAGTITIAPDDVIAIDDMDFERVLSEMADLGPKGELLVVTHSNPKGFLMPLKKGGRVSAELGVLEKLVNISAAIRERSAIDKASGRTAKAKAWQTWYRKHDPGIRLPDGYEEVNDDWQQYVEGKYDEWFDRQGKAILRLPGGGRDLGDFVKLFDRVRGQGFARLEFRACRIGTDGDALKTIARTLNVGQVVAPKEVRTFYAHIAQAEIVSPSRFDAEARRSPHGRTFGSIKLLLIMGDKTFRAVATHADHVKAFTKAYVSANFSGGVMPFVSGGLEPAGKSVIRGKRYVFPLESEYLGLLARYPSA
jgi:hypothetical protein